MPLSNDAIVKALQQQERKREDIEQMIQKRVDERVDESMEKVVQAFTSAIQGIEDTKTLRDLALAFAKEMNKET